MWELRTQGLYNTRRAMLTSDQLRAARALVKWSRDDLAEQSGVAAVTIKGFELLGADSKISTLNKLRRALEAAGVEFIDDQAKSYEGGPGVRFKPQTGRR